MDSIHIQTYKNYEVIITDDSKTSDVFDLVKKYSDQFSIKYFKNPTSLGSPGNWLACIEKATTRWIKLIHDDDWFSSPDSLAAYSGKIVPGTRILFSGYSSYFESDNTYKDETISTERFRAINREPSLLFARNLIGPPSVLMIDKAVAEQYDLHLTWFVDVEYYLRILQSEEAVYIDQPLVNVSYNDTQVTNYTRTNPAVVIPESLYIFSKHGKKVTSHIRAYDSWWRVYRNMGIRSVGDLQAYTGRYPAPPFLLKMIRHQSLVPAGLLKKGIVSKGLMSLSYILNKLSGLICLICTLVFMRLYLKTYLY